MKKILTILLLLLTTYGFSQPTYARSYSFSYVIKNDSTGKVDWSESIKTNVLIKYLNNTITIYIVIMSNTCESSEYNFSSFIPNSTHSTNIGINYDNKLNFLREKILNIVKDIIQNTSNILYILYF